jgi:hypothetical protein
MAFLVSGECVVDEHDKPIGEIECIRDGVSDRAKPDRWQARLYGPSWPAFTEHDTREEALDAISQAYWRINDNSA